MRYILQVNQMELFVYLGVEDEERSFRQKISISFEVSSKSIPNACLSDDINDTSCYGVLCDKIKQFIENNKFKLLEHLTFELHSLICAYTDKDVKITVNKIPPIKYVKEASFTIES